MSPRKFRILNVFTLEGQTFSGNPLCVVENAEGLSDEQMQAIALQFNLSETTFILPSSKATARVRIFMPHKELPFAGHPMVGSAPVVRELFSAGDKLTLETLSGVIPLTSQNDIWELTAAAPQTRPLEISPDRLAASLGLSTTDISAPAMWVNTGVEQLLVPLNSVEALRCCKPTLTLIDRAMRNQAGFATVYLWVADSIDHVTSRFFFEKANALCEDPGTGSACANLGGYLLRQNAAAPRNIAVDQGAQTGRPCRLNLRVDSAGKIKVSGKVTEFGRGEISL